MKKIKVFSFLGLGVAFLAPLFLLTSCSSTVNTVNAKILNSSNYTGTYSSLNDSYVSLENAMYGSNYNSGNYIFLYGTTGDKNFRDFIYGPNGNIGSGTNSTIQEQNFTTSSFINSFFTTGQIGNGLFSYNVEILTYIDLQPYMPSFVPPSDGSYANGVTPFDTWTAQQVLSEYNATSNLYTLETLPQQGKEKIGTYIRYDDSAVNYRESINYLLKIRPNITGIASNNQNGGLICFRNGFDPKTFDVTASSITSIISYYSTAK